MKTLKHIIFLTTICLGVFLPEGNSMADDRTIQLESATLAGGCFWCVEAVFEELEGVSAVISGYAGGKSRNVTYKDVCSGTTGHAEVVQIKFDPAVVSYAELLTVFFSVHDPTTLNRQGADVGTQYRSAVFWHTEAQKAVAADMIRQLTEERVFDAPIVTTLESADTFIPAEAYHQNYYRNNSSQGYCQAVINPKLYKFRQKFNDRLKK